jgi:hypothetical protein
VPADTRLELADRVSEILDPWTQEGRFWLPEQTAKTYGRIDYSPEHGLLVHLPESFLPRAELREPPAQVAALHGETLDGWPLTLLDGVIVPPRVMTLSTQGVDDLTFETLIRGRHVVDADEVVGTMASVGLGGLREFLRGGRVEDTPLVSTHPEDRDGGHCSVAVPWGKVALYASGGPSRTSRDEVVYVVSAHAQLEFAEEATLGQVDRAVAPLRDLITFSTRAPSVVSSLQLLGAKDPPDAHWQHHRRFKIVRPPEIAPEFLPKSDRYALLLNPATLGVGADVIARWYELRETLGAVWSLFFSTLSDPWMSPESQLLNLTSFAEGYHRVLHDKPPFADEEATAAIEAMLASLPDKRHRDHYRSRLQHTNSQSQRARIRWLTRRALDVAPVWELNPPVLCSQAVDTRNWLTHWGDRGDHVQEGDDLVRLCRRLYVILAINILLDLGLDEDDAALQLGSGLRLGGLP